ncbi:hypothetical protein [Catenulispora sp. EB89]|uniref:hypothetical protein n=1 Tax=Catenulispora sp. EB89 TaxID=3156257 RepID=UPI003515ACEA
MDDPRTKDEDKRRIIGDHILGVAATVLARNGDRKLAMLLANVVSVRYGLDPEDQSWDNLWIDVLPEDQPAYTEETIEQLKRLFNDIGERRSYPVGWVCVRQVLPEVGPGWQSQLKAQADGERPTNQGRRVRLAPPKFTEDGLWFTNAGELAVYRALKRLQDSVLRSEETIGIYPLAGGRVPGRTWEPDVLVTYKGRAGVIEVDGPHHNGRRAMDRTRDHLLMDAGVAFVDRIPVEVLDSPDELTEALQRFLRRLDGAK